MGKQAVLRASGEDAYNSLLRALNKRLVRLPVVDPPPVQVRAAILYKSTFFAAAIRSTAGTDYRYHLETLMRI